MNISRKLELLLIIAPFVMATAIFAYMLAGGRPGMVKAQGGATLPPYVLPGLAVAMILDAVVMAAITWRVRRRRKTGHRAVPGPAELAKAAEIQAKRAGAFIDRVTDPARREQLARELSEIQAGGSEEVSKLDVVVFGTVSAGKTSLINTLLGREAGATDAVMGTTRHGERHTYELKSVHATVLLTDTPGLSEAGAEGEARETEARALAVRADLLLFVVDHDLIRSEYEPLIELARLGKRSIVVLNKKDRFLDEDLNAILAKLRERLSGAIDPDDIVAVAAAPRPLPVRVANADGSFHTVYEPEQPDITALRTRISNVLRGEGKLLHAANLLVRGKVLEREAQDQIAHERELKAMAVVEHHQWVTAGAVFANPIPALDILAGGAVQFDMIAELARVHGQELSPGQIRILAGQMVQSLLKLGLIEAATSLVAGIFKRSLVGFAAGGAVQAAAMAYLTRVSGKAFIDYFRAGQSWGTDGINGVLLRQFDLNSRSEFLQDFTTHVVQTVLRKLPAIGASGPTALDRKKHP